MKLHLPFGLRKALLSCLTALSAALPVTLASGTLGAEDITLGGENSIAPDEELDASVHAVLRAAEEQEEAMLISETSFGIDPDPLSRPYSGNFDDLPETVLQPASREGTLALDSTVDQSAQLARQSLLQLKEDRLFSNTAVIASDGVQVLEATATPEGVPGILATNNWGLVFEDQFDGKSSDDSALNTRLWTRIPYESPNQANNWRAHQSIDKDLVSFEDKDGNSTMRLWGKYGKHTNQNNQNNTTQDVYACGGVRSQGVFSFQYGYVEVRAKYENAQGVWPAIWMMPERVQAGLDGGGWPRSGEIDIMEHLNYEGKFYQTLHRAAAKGGVDSQISVAQPTLNKDAWHTYGVEWTAQSITFYLDGGQTGKIAWDESGYTLYGAKGAVTGSHTWTEGERELWPFDYAGNTFYLILDQQIGGGWPGNPDDASKKTLSSQGVSMWIDYVKVYSDVEKYNHLGKCTLTWQEAGGTWAETEGSLWNKGAFLAADSVVFGEVTTKDVTISGAVHATNMDVNAAGYTFTGARDDAKLVVRETLTLADGATVNLAVSAEIGRLSGAGNLTTSGTGKTLCLYTWNGDYSADPYTGTITVSNGWNLVVSSAGVSAGTIDLTQQGDNNYLVFDSNNSGVYLGDITLNANLVGVKNVQGRGGRKVTITGTVSGVDRVLSVTKYSGAGLSNCFVFEGDVSRFTGFDATTGMANTTSVFTSGIAAFTFKAGLALSGDTTFNVGDYDNDSASNANPKPVSRNWIELTETSRLTGEGDIIKTGAGELEIDGDTSGYSGTMRLQVGKLILDGIDGSQVDVSLENATADANVVNLNASKRAGASGGVLRSVGMGGEAVSGKVMLGAGAKWTLQEVTLTTGETLTIGGAAGSSITLGGAGGMNLTGGTLVLGAGVAFGGQLNITLTGSDLPAGLIGLEAGANLKGLKLSLVGLQQAVEAAGGILEWKYQLFSLPTVGEDGQNDAQKALAQEWLNQMDVPYEGCSLFVDERGFISLRKADLVWDSPSDTVWKEGKTGWGEGGTDVFQSGCTVTFGATSAAKTVIIDGPVSVNNMNVNGAYTFSGNGSNSQLKVGGALSLGGNATIELSSTIAVLSGTGDLTIGNTGTNVVAITEVEDGFSGSIKLANESRLTLSDTTYSGTLKLTGNLAYLIAKNENLNVKAEGQGEHVLSFFQAQQIGNATGLSGINVGGDGVNATVKDLTAGVGGATFTFDNSRNGSGGWAGYSGSLTVTGAVSGYTGFVAKHAGARTYSDIIFTGTVSLGTEASFNTVASSNHNQPADWAGLSIIEFSDGSVITGANTTITKTGAGKLKIAGDTSKLTGTLKLQGGVLELNGIDGSGIAVTLENATVNANVVNLGGNGGVLKSVGVGESVTSGKVMLAAGASWTLNEISLTNNKTLTISGGEGSSVNLGEHVGIDLTGGTLELGSGVAFSGELKIALTGSSDPTRLIKLQENVNLDALGLSLTGLGTAIGSTQVSTWSYQLFSGDLNNGVLDLAEAWLAGAKLDEDYADYKLVPDAHGAVSLELRYLTWNSTTDGVWRNNDATGHWKREGTFSNGKSVTFSGEGTEDVIISGAVQPADMTVSGSGYKFQEGEGGTNNLEVTGTLNLAENTTTTLGLKATIARLTGGTASAGGEEGLAVAAETTAPELIIERTGKDADAAHEVWIKDASGYNGTIKVKGGGLLVVRLAAGTGTFTAPGTTVDLNDGGVLAFDNNGGTSDGITIYGGNVVFDANLTGVTGLQGKGGWQVTINGSVQGVGSSLTVSMYNGAGFSDCLVFAGDVSGFTGFDASSQMCNINHFTPKAPIAAFTFEKGLDLANDTTFNVGKYSNDAQNNARHWIELTETSRLTGTGDIIKTGVGELEIDGDTSGYSGTMRLQAGKLILDGIDGTNVSVSLENTSGDANVLNLNGTKRTPAEDGEELTGSVLKSVGIGEGATSGKVMLGAGASWTLNEIALTGAQTLTISGGAGSSVNLGGDEGVNLTDGTLALDGGVTFYGALNVALAEDNSPKIDLKDTTDFSNLGLHVTGLSNVIVGSADDWSYQLFSTSLSGDLLAGVKNWLKGVDLGTSYKDSYRLSVKSDGQIYLRPLVLTWVGGEVTWTEGSEAGEWEGGNSFEGGDQVLFEETGKGPVEIDGAVTATEMTVNVSGYTFSAKAEGKEGDALTVTGTLNLEENAETTIALSTTINKLSGNGNLTIGTTGTNVVAITEVEDGFSGSIKLANESRLTLSDTTYSGTLKLTGELAYLTAKNGNLKVEAEGQGEHVLSFFQTQQIGNATGLSGINVGGDGANATVKDLTAGVGGATFTFDNSRNGEGGWAGYSGSLMVTGTVSGYSGFVAKHAGNRTYSDIIFTGTVELGETASFDTEGSSSHKTPQVGTWASLSIIEFSAGSVITGTNTTITKTGAGKLKIAGDTSGLTGTLKLQGGGLELNGIDGSGMAVTLENDEAETTLQGAGVLGSVGIGGDAASGEVVLGTGASWRVENMGIQKGQRLTITGGTDANVRFGTEAGEVSSMVLGGTLALNGGTYDGALKLQLGSDAREDGVQIVIGDGVEIGREDVKLRIEVTAAFIERLNETWRYKLFDGNMTEELAAHVLVEPDEDIRKKGCTFTVGSDGYLTVARLAERYWNGGPAPLEWGGDSTPWTDREGKGAYSWENERVLEDRNRYMDVHFTAESGEHTVNVLNQEGGPIEADQLTIGGAAAGKTQSYTFSGGSLEIQKSLTSGANTDLKVENSITVKGKAEVEGVLTVSGGGEVSVGTNSSVKAVMVEEEGKFTAGKGLKVAGNLEVNGTAQFEQVEVGGKVSVGQGAELNSTDTLTVQSLEVHGNLNSAGALMAQSLEVHGNVSLDGGGAVKGDVTLGNGGSLKATGNLEIAGKVVAEGGSLVVQQGGKLITGAWEGSLSSLTLNYGASVTMNETIAGTVNLGALVHNGDSELVLDGLKDVSDGMMLSVSGTTGDGQLTVRLSTEFLGSIVNGGNQYTLFDTRNHAEITGIEIAEELGYIIGMDWKTGILTVEMEAAPEIEPDSVYTSSEQNDSDEWKTREPGANIYYDVASYEEIRIDKNTSINISDASRPEYHFGGTGLVLHNLQGAEAEAELSVIGGAKNDIVTLQDWENEKTDSRVVTYGGTLKVENAKLRIDHGKRDEEGVVLNEEKAASVFANFTGSLDLSKGKGLEMVLGVLELSGAENDLGSGGITFTNATELSQLILSAGETRAAGEITVQTATMFAALNESPVDEETQPIGRQEHILLQDGATLALGAESKNTTIGDGVVIGYAPAAPTATDDGSARSADAAEDSEALTGTVSMRGKVNLAAGARVTGVHMEFEEGAEVTWEAGSAAPAQDEIYGLVATGGKLSGGKDIAIRVKEWKPGVCSPTMCSGMDFSNYTGKMTIRKSENNQVFAGVTGGAGWNMDVESGGRVVFDVLNDAGQNAAWTMGDVTLRSGAILTLCFTLDGPTMLRATSQPNMSFNSFSAEKGARLTLYSDSVIPPTEESYVLGTVTDVMKSGLGEDSIIIPELQGTAFWRVSEARVCLEGRELLLKISMDGNNKLLAAMDPNASQNAKAGAEALWQLVGKTDSARVMGELADPDSDIKKLADDAGLRSEFGDAKGLEKLMAGSVGASFVGVAPALGQDMHRQLSAIRNRTASMGSEVSPTDGTDGRTSWHAWINAESGYHELDDDGLQPGYRLNGWGGTVGIDADVSPSTTVGLALSAMYNDLKSSAADSMTSDLDTCYLSFFQRHMSGRWSHTLVLSVGMASLDSKRTVALTGGSYTASGDTDGYALGALYEVGYTHGLDPERFGALQSVFNVEFRRVSLSGFEEHGSAAALHVDDMEETVVTFGAGLRYQRFMGTRAVNRSALLELRALARVDAGDTRGEAVTGFLDGDYRNHLRGAEIGRIGAELGAGVTVPVGTSGSIFVDASLELRSGYTSFDASAGYRIGF